jgi:hypothetical protein
MNKILFLFISSLFISRTLTAQVTITSGDVQAEPSAGLNVDFTDKGFLVPRLYGGQILSIENPATGLMVFNLSDNKPVFFDGNTWRNQNGKLAWLWCGDPLEVIHIAGAIAPVSKNVTYSTVNDIPGEPDKCWITSNLGSNRQATASNDTTEASRGWYWQFNRKQGYKYSGTARTPNTAWITTIDEITEWLPDNDPCAGELGGNWRLPTETEWKNVDAAGGWTSLDSAWKSDLKLHAAGRLNPDDGVLAYAGTDGRYWSNGIGNKTQGWLLRLRADYSYVDSAFGKSYGCSVRCIQCPLDSPPEIPEGGTHVPSYNQITWKWNTVPGATGYKWSPNYNYGMALDMETDTQYVETGLYLGSTIQRYIWAYNDCNHSAPAVITSTTLDFSCGNSVIYKYHVAGNVAPVTKSTSYGTVENIPGTPGMCWITSNLGSDHQAIAVDDATEASAGWYWQFNRKQGYKHTGTTVTPSWPSTYTSENSDWVLSNDPCAIELGSGWRVPTRWEWIYTIGYGSWSNWYGPWNSALKMHAAGDIIFDTGGLIERGSHGRYWSSSQYSTNNLYGWYLLFYESDCIFQDDLKAFGYSIRCIKQLN